MSLINRQKYRRFWEGMMNILWPPKCGRCGVPTTHAHTLCASCWSLISFITGNFCQKCGQPHEQDNPTQPSAFCASCLQDPPPYTASRAVALYDDGIRPLILSLKHGDRLDLLPLFSLWLNSVINREDWNPDMIIPIPLHWTRLLSRKFNQSQELARALSLRQHISVHNHILLRHRRTKPQKGLSRTQRRKNLQGAFRISTSKTSVNGKSILLIDDVRTTGATLDTAATALKKAGAKNVYVLTLAIVKR